MKVRITDSRLREIKSVEKRIYIFDTTQVGLVAQVTVAGTKTFQLRFWDSTRKQTVVQTIGRYPDISISDARAIVAEKVLEIKRGIDVAAMARKKRYEEPFDTTFQRWLEFAKLHKRSWVTDRQRYDLHIKKRFGNIRVSEIDRESIKHWFHGLTQKVKPATANRILAIIKTVYNQELPDSPNPTKGIKMFTEESRERFLRPEELRAFFTALDDQVTPEYLKDYVLLSLYTGARKSNVLSMQWVDVDFDLLTWTIRPTDSKNKSSMTIPIVDEVLEILQRRKKSLKSLFVLPSVGRSKSKTGHMVDPRLAWADLLKRANLDNLRLHDLRRTLGSYQTITGASGTIVGKTLGHKSPSSTAVYARLNLDPVRASMENAVSAMQATKDLPEKIIKIGKK